MSSPKVAYRNCGGSSSSSSNSSGPLYIMGGLLDRPILRLMGNNPKKGLSVRDLVCFVPIKLPNHQGSKEGSNTAVQCTAKEFIVPSYCPVTVVNHSRPEAGPPCITVALARVIKFRKWLLLLIHHDRGRCGCWVWAGHSRNENWRNTDLT